MPNYCVEKFTLKFVNLSNTIAQCIFSRCELAHFAPFSFDFVSCVNSEDFNVVILVKGALFSNHNKLMPILQLQSQNTRSLTFSVITLQYLRAVACDPT